MLGIAMTGLRVEERALAEVVRRLVAAYQPERIYLFGSAARGEAGVNGDYDLLVIVPDDASEERRRSRLAYTVLHGTGTAADVLVCPIATSRSGCTCAPPFRRPSRARACSCMPHDPIRVADTRACPPRRRGRRAQPWLGKTGFASGGGRSRSLEHQSHDQRRFEDQELLLIT
jgi:predicted nucleotidyltransferase